jgi:hypothetical protein
MFQLPSSASVAATSFRMRNTVNRGRPVALEIAAWLWSAIAISVATSERSQPHFRMSIKNVSACEYRHIHSVAAPL